NRTVTPAAPAIVVITLCGGAGAGRPDGRGGPRGTAPHPPPARRHPLVVRVTRWPRARGSLAAVGEHDAARLPVAGVRVVGLHGDVVDDVRVLRPVHALLGLQERGALDLDVPRGVHQVDPG